MRTCVGCRQRDAQSQMIRFVMSRGDEDGASPGVVADPRQVRPGRGAWLHDDAGCAERAIARKAFQRALRVPHDITINGLTIAAGPLSSASTTRRQGSGLEADGHPMSTQR
ncbi:MULTISPECIES: YlxR family protein [Sanguibacter]|uniref:YlxR family protein n=1 Tax=Sanguibacter TaxID=60919 RepID=UPI002285EB4B|nr:MULTISPECIES: YlxR family protein [Sanguibacter]